MHTTDWPIGGAVKNDFEEEMVQEAVAEDEARKGLLDGIQDALDDNDEPGVESLQALLDEVDRRRRVMERRRVHMMDRTRPRSPTAQRQMAGR